MESEFTKGASWSVHVASASFITVGLILGPATMSGRSNGRDGVWLNSEMSESTQDEISEGL